MFLGRNRLRRNAKARHLIAVALQHAAADAGHGAGYWRDRSPADSHGYAEVRVQLHVAARRHLSAAAALLMTE